MPESRYSAGDMMAMQRDAVRRVREMQRRANEKLHPPHPAPPQSPPPARPPAPPPGGGGPPAGVPADGLSAFLGRMELDQEKIMLLLLIVLLLREGADTRLILALCYLLI